MQAHSRQARITTIDAIRGFAVLGILLMNIVDFAMPAYAYSDPHYYGGDTGANWWTWALIYVFADGKMRGLFTLLFGASLALVAEGAIKSEGNAARVHYNRMAVLLLIGLAHAYLVWSGDILVLYAVCGSVAFVAWRARAVHLAALGVALLLTGLGLGIHDYSDGLEIVRRAAEPDASSATQAQARELAASFEPEGLTVEQWLAGYRGGWVSVMALRIEQAFLLETRWFPTLLPDTLAMMFIGMALLKSGFLAGAWPRRRYLQLALAGLLVAAPLHIPLIGFLERHAFSTIALIFSDSVNLNVLRPLICLALASTVILLVQSGWAAGLFRRLEAVGQMALSNYLGTSVVCTTLFYGTGFGLYGKLERWQLYGVVALVWAAILAWSLPWLKRYRQGPAEWAWRCLARRRWEPLRR